MSSYARDDGERLPLFDPLAVPGELLTWRPTARRRSQIAEGLRPLLELPVEHVLPTHGAPTDRAALERASSSS